MNTAKKTWVAPKATLEEFTPNEYVSACWGVACNVDDANAYEKRINNYHEVDLYHGADHCGTSGNQAIYLDSNGRPDHMTEIGTDRLGNLVCTIYTDDNYRNIRTIGSVRVGETIYWTTTSGNKTWHHQGLVTATVLNHPNQS